jgi:hypothetical protein
MAPEAAERLTIEMARRAGPDRSAACDKIDRMVNQYLRRFVPQSSKQGLDLYCLSARSKTHDAQ